MAEASSMTERAAIVVLAASGGRLSAKDLRVRHGVDLKKPFRERLARAGLIRSEREGPSFALELTDDGWSLLDGAISNDPPAGRGVGPGGRALFALLAALSERNARMSALLREAAPPPPQPLATLEDRVVRAYHDLAKEKREWVALTALRRALADVDRTDLDSAIKQMHRNKSLMLTLEENQSRLSKEDRTAALRLGPDNMHYISMD